MRGLPAAATSTKMDGAPRVNLFTMLEEAGTQSASDANVRP